MHYVGIILPPHSLLTTSKPVRQDEAGIEEVAWKC